MKVNNGKYQIIQRDFNLFEEKDGIAFYRPFVSKLKIYKPGTHKQNLPGDVSNEWIREYDEIREKLYGEVSDKEMDGT
jgi:hypothetical protein